MIHSTEPAVVPDYLPARMVNEFVYCPRLFYYEWVEGLFADNRETIEGSLRHQKLDARQDELIPADELTDEDKIHSRSVTLSSDTHRVIAKMDLVEAAAGCVTPVDYKRGAPKKDSQTGNPTVWDTDEVQLAVQAIVLRDNGYRCEEGVVYYVKTKQRVRVPMTDQLIAQTLETIGRAFETAGTSQSPPPLVDSPKCPRCSLVGICLPDETTSLTHGIDAHSTGDIRPELRRLVPARDDLRPLYLNMQGLSVGKSGHVLQVREKRKVIQEIRINDISQLNLFGNVQLTTQALQTLCSKEIPVAFYSMGGWFYGLTQGLGLKNIFLRREQFRKADEPEFCLHVAKAIVSGKIRNQRTLLQRNHIEPPPTALAQMKCLSQDANAADNMPTLLGIEGNAARVYFENFSGMLKVDGADPLSDDSGQGESAFRLDFEHRNRRPPRDPVNALLSLAYSVLAKDLTNTCCAVGFDSFLGFYHQPRFGRPALALDIMEPFRPLIADSVVLSAINTRMITVRDFVRAGNACALTPNGRKNFFRAYEQRMDALATHPLFGYRVNYRRLLEIQTRLLARVVTGELQDYPPFVTR